MLLKEINLTSHLNRIKYFLGKILNRFSIFISEPMTKLRIILILLLLIKSIFFTTILSLSKSNFYDNCSYSFVYLISIIFIYSFGYLLPRKPQIVFYILFDLIFSILLMVDLWYFRVNGDFIGIKNLLYKTTFNPSEKSLVNFKYYDLILFADMALFSLQKIIVKAVYIIYPRIKNNRAVFVRISSTRNINNSTKKPKPISIKNFLISLTLSILLFIISIVYFEFYETSAFHNKLIYKQRSPLKSVQAVGPLNYHIFQDITSLYRKISHTPDSEDLSVDNWFKTNTENLSDNEYKGVAKNKNVIFLQVESLENFVINQTVNNKEITPFLNSLCKNGLYFDNFYEQNNGGHSIDCDFLVNTSILPLGSDVTAIAYGENIYENSLPRILSSQGYETITSHPETPGDFNWMELHKNCFGVDHVYSINDYEDNEDVGYGLSDKSSLTQFSERLSTLNKPFFAQTCTLTSHGPFNIDKKYRELDLPDEINNNYLGGYFESLHYTDKQIQMFFTLLKNEDLLDNSIIVIYGDHTGVHKYYNDSIQSLNYEGNWWKDFDHKIPLIIYSKDMPSNTINSAGGQVDILPTICYLLGIDDNKYRNTSMGRVLVNTERNATVIKDTETDSSNIKGLFKDYNEERHLLDAYKTGEKIIKGY